jgi:hypothetical protein
MTPVPADDAGPAPLSRATGEVDEQRWIPTTRAVGLLTYDRDVDVVRGFASSGIDGCHEGPGPATLPG